MLQMRNPSILRAISVITAVCLAAFPGWANSVAASGLSGPAQTNRYVFLSDQSTLVQTGGIAGVHRIYAVQGQFQLTVDFRAGTAWFARVDANAIDDSPWRRTLDPNQVFAMTALVGTVVSDTTLEFTGKAANGSDVRITATLGADQVHLVAETVPPPNSADFFLFSMDAVAQRKYAGGTGGPADPYQIATAADLILLGESPADYDKHFILTADIDLDPNLPGRRVFDRAVIAPDTVPGTFHFDGTAFSGVLDGNGHAISHLTIQGDSWVGLFGNVLGGEVRDLGVVDVNMTSSDDAVGGLAGRNWGAVNHCYSTGSVSGIYDVGGLVGYNAWGTISNSYSTGSVSGTGGWVGGLVGCNEAGTLSNNYSTGSVTGIVFVGGLVGCNGAGTVSNSFWDTTTSGRDTSEGGTGLTTAQMQTAATFLLAGWDFVGETANGTADIWWINEGKDYPRLWWEKYSAGSGTADDPYRIATATDLIALGENPADYDKHFVLTADIDLDPNLPGRKVFDRALIAPDVNDLQYSFQGMAFTGAFDGGGHAIRNLTIADPNHDYLGLFGMVAASGRISNLALDDVEISGGRHSINVGTLAGFNAGTLAECSATGIVIGCGNVRELAGSNSGTITNCHADVRVSWLCI